MRDYADCPNDDITPVGLYPPNGWGIHDVLHTLSELTGDWYGRDYYAVSPEVDPQGPALGEGRSVRGTCYWGMDESRVSDRGWVTLEEPFEFTSFRLVADADVPLEKRPGETQRLRLRRGAK
jgi:formylglycine-generating enzyme required for sulfatase activity